MRRPVIPVPARIPIPVSAAPVAALLVCGLLLTAGTACSTGPPSAPAPARLSPDDVIRAATQRLTDDCLARHGFTPPTPGRSEPPGAERTRVAEAMFGAGRTELSLRLPTGHVVRAHTDGCLAEAQRRLYGDQRRWFRTSTVVNNLAPEAAHTDRTLAEVRADRRTELAEWRRLRSRALTEATSLISSTNPPPPKGNTAQ
ncbi:hypothetical protein [Streptomyces caniscabiei]|uniref:hypothetical protein n=1 Tax=Streptomyces caniscabiei TaxID=2746961 RepID=UPI001CE122EC|nr:hypothetical protein [Streptomyces caniscabiei]MDX3507561.1 hypothetical protein [Streptomyces caniscabiei]MDX3717523.1 hypothetical protein [Streptomyces caniscabiei]WEO25277.1 hypothetical protein IHE65_19985 [Streptomyces caniscabiei]